MSATVLQVRSTTEFERLHVLLIEYENSLPVDLRHGSVPEVQRLEAAYGGRGAAFLATIEDAAAGCVGVIEHDPSTAIVQRLYVTPAHRNLGVARSLVGAAIEFAQLQRFRRVVLDTDRERLRAAYELYRAFGFTICEPYGAVDYASPTFMELRLA
jgi:GNAT superfamily N-acetyltransferase